MQTTNYVKLSGVTEFLLEEILGTEYFAWDATINKPKRSQDWFEGAQKKYNLATDKGQMSVSQGQFSQILLAAFDGNSSDPVGKTYTVKTNGKSGLDLRYFIDLKKGEQIVEQVDMSNLPF